MNRYFTYKELSTELKALARKNPKLIKLETIGKSFEGRPIILAAITDYATGKPETKPALWADANIHATELAGTTAVMTLIETLLNGHRKGDKKIRELLATKTFYLVPRLNPDGAERALSIKPEFLRSSVRPYPFYEKEEGVHLQDIDGDGRILQMRIPDPCGDYKISSLDPRLMQKRAPDETGGKYYRLFGEGLLHEFDGFIINSAKQQAGLDLNRNFPYHWRPEGDQVGAGDFPASEPEVHAMVKFFATHRNISVALNYHTYSGMLLRPYSDKPDSDFDANDLWVYDRLGKRGTEITDYVSGSSQALLKYHPKEVITGVGDEWLFEQHGIFAWTVEIWDILKQAGVKRQGLEYIEWYRDHPHEQDLQILKWFDQAAKKHQIPKELGFIPWYKFEHPQLGQVELGGWNLLYTWRNPPHALMGQEAKKNVEFAIALAQTLPELKIHTLNCEALSDGLFKVILCVENRGFLPTFTSEKAKKSKLIRPVRATLTGATLVQGKTKMELGHLEGRSNKLDVASFGYIQSKTDHRAKCEWIVRAKKGATVTIQIESERCGMIKQKLKLT